MRKRILSGFAALTLVMSLGAAAVSAETAEGEPAKRELGIELPIIKPTNIIASGTCGGSCTWKLDSEGLLTISGTGEMENYHSDGKGIEAPWNDTYYTKITKVKVENGVTSIGDAAFHDCINLTEVTVGESVKKIGYTAFFNSGVESVTLPEGLTEIDDKAFLRCEALKELTIPAGVTSIGEAAFKGCIKLKKAVIPAGVTAIPDSAFSGCSKLESVEIPEGVKSIGKNAFEKCPQLLTVTVPDSVTEIGEFALGYKTTSLIKPEKVEGFLIRGGEGSAAEKYAKDNGLAFEKIGGSPALIMGDLDDNGAVEDADVALLQQYLADWKVTINEKVADVTGDGNVSEADIALMQQYLADWKVTLG